MSGAKHKQKGNRKERDAVKLLKEAGIQAARVPLSGSVGGDFAGDIRVSTPHVDVEFQVEVKARKDAVGFKTVRDWLGSNDMLFCFEDHIKFPLVVMGWERFSELLRAYIEIVEERDCEECQAINQATSLAAAEYARCQTLYPEVAVSVSDGTGVRATVGHSTV